MHQTKVIVANSELQLTQSLQIHHTLNVTCTTPHRTEQLLATGCGEWWRLVRVGRARTNGAAEFDQTHVGVIFAAVHRDVSHALDPILPGAQGTTRVRTEEQRMKREKMKAFGYLNGVGNVRHDLHRFAQIIAATLFAADRNATRTTELSAAQSKGVGVVWERCVGYLITCAYILPVVML